MVSRLSISFLVTLTFDASSAVRQTFSHCVLSVERRQHPRQPQAGNVQGPDQDPPGRRLPAVLSILMSSLVHEGGGVVC